MPSYGSYMVLGTYRNAVIRHVKVEKAASSNIK